MPTEVPEAVPTRVPTAVPAAAAPVVVTVGWRWPLTRARRHVTLVVGEDVVDRTGALARVVAQLRASAAPTTAPAGPTDPLLARVVAECGDVVATVPDGPVDLVVTRRGGAPGRAASRGVAVLTDPDGAPEEAGGDGRRGASDDVGTGGGGDGADRLAGPGPAGGGAARRAGRGGLAAPAGGCGGDLRRSRGGGPQGPRRPRPRVSGPGSRPVRRPSPGRVPGASPRTARGGTAAPGLSGTAVPARSGADDERPEDDDTGWGEAAPAPDEERILRERPPHWG